MNKVYKVVWNASLGIWVAVSELAKGKTKSRCSVEASCSQNQQLENVSLSSAFNYKTLSLAIFTVFTANFAHAGYYAGNNGGCGGTAELADTVAIGSDGGNGGGTSGSPATGGGNNVGNAACVYSPAAMAIGNNARAYSYSSIAIGSGAQAGQLSQANGTSHGADGNGLNGSSAMAIGNDAKAIGIGTTAIGRLAQTNADRTTVIGNQSYIKNSGSTNSIIIGNNTEIGDSTTAVANATAIGQGGKILATGGTTVGQGAEVSIAGSVAIGQGAKTTAIGGAGFLTGSTAPASVVSVGGGTTTETRRIQNLADGANAQDAVTVAQLDKAYDDTNGRLASVLGGNATYDSSTNIYTAPTNIGGTGKNTIDEAISSVKGAAETPMTFVGNARNSGDTKDVERKLGESLTISGAATTAGSYSGKNVRTVTDQTGSIAIQIADAPNFAGTVTSTGQQVNGNSVVTGTSTIGSGANAVTLSGTANGLDVGGKKITNVAAPTLGSDATNKTYVDGKVQTLADTPLGFVGDSGTKATRKLGEDLNVKGGATGTLTNGNIGVVSNGSNQLDIKLAETVNLGTNGSVTTGNTKIDNSGLTITGGPSITTTGIDAGGSKITNVGNATTASDAVNKGQLDSSLANANSNAAVVYTNAAGDKVTKAADGKWYAATGVNADGSLIGRPSEVAAANIITSVQNASGSTTTATKLSNVAAGSVTASSTDAINGSQLYNTANNVKNLIGGTTTIDANTGVITTSNIGGTGKNTIDEAISSVKGAAETPMTFVGNARNSGDTKDVERKLGESLKISGAATTAGSYSGKNVRTVTNQTGSIAIELADNLDVTSVTAGDSTLNNNGLSITGGPSITKTDGINAGGSKITNVGNATTASDAVNKGQLDSSLANANSNAAVVYTNAAGDKVTKAADGKWYAATNVNADGSLIGSPSEVAAANIITSVQNASGSTTTATKLGNVAAGSVTASSTDAINGSQLYNTANNVKNLIGGTTTIDANTGVITTSNIGGTGKNTIDEAISSVKGAAETPMTFVGNARNSGDTKDVERKLGESLKISGAATTAGSYSGKNVRTVTNQTGSIAIELADNLDVTSVTAGDSTLNNNGLSITGGPSITKTDGINAGGSKITNVGNATTASDAVNKGQLDSSLANANSNAAVVYTNAAGNKVTKAADGKWYAATDVNADGSLIGSPSEVAAANIITSVQNANGSTTTATKLGNVAAGSVTASSTDAINGSQLYNTANNVKNLIGGTTTIDANTGVITTSNIGGTGKNTIDEAISSVKGAAETPMTFVGNARNSGNTKDVERKLGESLTISGAATTAGSYSGKNVKTVTDQTGSIAIELADNLDVTSVTAGDSTLNNNGLSITGGPSITKTGGINAGGSKITNVGNATTASDAVNKGQLDSSLANANSNAAVVYTNAAGNKVTKAADGKWYAATDVNADGSLIGSPSEVAAANIITSVQNANGSTTTATKLGNVAAGSVTASSTDAINGSQLYNTANNVKNLIGGTTTIDANTGVITTSNIGGTGQNTIDEAITEVSKSAKAAKTTVTAGENVEVTSTVDSIDGHTNYIVKTAKDVSFDKVTVGNVVIDKSTNTISGLSNKDLTAADFATQGRAATEEQLKQVISSNITEVVDGNGNKVNIIDQVVNTKPDNKNQDSLFLTYNKQGQETSDRLTIGQTVQKMNTEGVKFFHTNAATSKGGLGTTNDSSAGGLNSTAVGVNAIVETNAVSALAVGHNTKAGGAQSIAIGNGAEALGTQSISIGTGNKVTGDHSGAIGDPTIVDGSNSYSVGNNNQVLTDDTFVLGNNVTQTVTGSVVLGTGSAATTGAGVVGYALSTATTADKTAISNTTSTTGAVAIGDAANGIYRQITGVAAGSQDSDAVNVAQLKAVGNQVTTDISNIKNEINNGSLGLVQQTGGSKADITVGKNTGGTTVNMAGKDGDRVITGVKDGAINATSKDAINGSQLHAQKVETNQKVVEFLGGGAGYDNITNSFTNPTYTVGGKEYNNVGGAVDALNKADQALDSKIDNVSNRLEQAFYSTNQRIDDVEKRANAGIAAAMAMEAAPYISGKWTYAVGAAYHGGEQAVGATLRKTADNGRWSLTGGVATGTEGDPSVRIGISGVID